MNIKDLIGASIPIEGMGLGTIDNIEKNKDGTYRLEVSFSVQGGGNVVLVHKIRVPRCMIDEQAIVANLSN